MRPNENMVHLNSGAFMMGAPEGEGYPEDGEGPRRAVTLRSFSISKFAVTKKEFGVFVEQTGYETTAEKLGYSYVFHLFLTAEQKRSTGEVPADTPWWYPTSGASWRATEGRQSDWTDREDHPVVHVSWFDAVAYCNWAGYTLPTEAQWEYAARAGSDQTYPWGSELTPEGRHMCNVWQGRFPGQNTAKDGYIGTAPVSEFAPNEFDLSNMIGNVWEWCADSFTPDYHCITPDDNPLNTHDKGSRSMRGGSFLCHESYCNRYRLGARNGNLPDTTCSNVGFRVSG